MTAGDNHFGIAFHQTCRTHPVVARSVGLLVGEVAGTATEHNTNPRFTVGGIICAGSGEAFGNVVFEFSR